VGKDPGENMKENVKRRILDPGDESTKGEKKNQLEQRSKKKKKQHGSK